MVNQEYNELFRQLFPKEWRNYFMLRFNERGMTLAEVFADAEGGGAELVKATNDAPPLEDFCALVEKYYFPIPDFWVDMVEVSEDGDMDHFILHEIPIQPYFESEELGGDPHYLWPIFQVLQTLNGRTYMPDVHAQCGKRCELRALFILACNEIHRTDQRRLETLCKKEQGPLRDLAFARRVMAKETGNIWFDFDYETYRQTGIDWSLKNVRAVARWYKKAREDMKRLNDLNDWFHKDMRRIRDASVLWREAATL